MLKVIKLLKEASCVWGTVFIIAILFAIFKEIPILILLPLTIVAYLLLGAIDYGKPE